MSIIAISEETCTGGHALARCVAERLACRCVSQEKVIEAAAQYGVPADRLTGEMEKAPSFWERMGGHRAEHLVYVRAILCETALGGNLVYASHAGHLMLPRISHVVRVRVIADMEYRVKLAMEQRNLTREDARSWIGKLDRERTEWVRSLFGVDWNDPSLYDAVVNLGRMSLPTACELVCQMAQAKEFQPTAESLKAMGDLALSSTASAELARDHRTELTGLDVSADAGVVTITGVVRRPELEEAIRTVVGEVSGVKEVRFHLTAPPTSHLYPE